MDNSERTGAQSPDAGEQHAGTAADRIKDSAASVVESSKRAAIGAATDGAADVADRADSAAAALRRAADDVAGDNRWIGAALRKGAETIERAGQSISGGDLDSAVKDLNGFARRQPALFLGASVALGFALARVGKTTIEHADTGTPASSEPTHA